MNDLFSSSRKNLKGTHAYSILISIIGWSFPFWGGVGELDETSSSHFRGLTSRQDPLPKSGGKKGKELLQLTKVM